MARRKDNFYNGDYYVVDEKSQVVRLMPKFHNELLNGDPRFVGFKKFGGSSIADIFETDNFKSQFNAFCHMTRLKMPVLQMKYIRAGVILEPKIFEYLDKIFGKKLDIEHIEAKQVDYDYFKDVEKIGGIPDGLIKSKKMVLEIKTVNEKKYPYWTANNNAGVPIDYRKQAQLYARLLNYKTYSIVALFLQDGDYDDPAGVNLTKRRMQNFNYKVNNAEADDDIKKIIKFYDYYSLSGQSPKYDLIKDADQVEYLKCRNRQEWKNLFERWKKEGKVDEDIDFETV